MHGCRRFLLRGGLLPLLPALLLLGCMAVPVEKEVRVWRPVPASPEGQAQASPHRRIEPGDRVRVQTRSGKTHILDVVSVGEAGFIGEAWNRKTYEVPYEALARMELEAEGTRKGWKLIELPFVAPVGYPTTYGGR